MSANFNKLITLIVLHENKLLEDFLKNEKMFGVRMIDLNYKQNGISAIIIAVQNNNYPAIVLLAKYGANLHVRDQYNRSLLDIHNQTAHKLGYKCDCHFCFQ